MAPRKKTTPKTFKAAYQILKTNAEALQNSNEPDIDNLMTTVEQSIEAYKVCQARIEAVQQALDAAFDNEVVNNEVVNNAQVNATTETSHANRTDTMIMNTDADSVEANSTETDSSQ